MDGTYYVEAGGGVDTTYTANKFFPYLLKQDPLNTLPDVVFFDTSINMQKDGQVLAANYP